MGENLRSKVVKPLAKSRRKRESTSVQNGNKSLPSEEDLMGKVPTRKNFVYQNLSMATENVNSNSILRRAKQVLDYSKLNKNSIMEARANEKRKDINSSKQTVNCKSMERSRGSAKGSTKVSD